MLASASFIGGLVLTVSGFWAISGQSGFVDSYLGLTSLAIAWGLVKGKGWGWDWFVITGAFGITILLFILFGPLTLGELAATISGLVFDAISLYYVTRESVMRYFGKTSVLSEFI